LKNATDCCQTEWQIQQYSWGSARIARVAQQCLYEKRLQMIENEQWPPNNSPNFSTMEIAYHVWGATHKAILIVLSEA